MTHLFKQVLKLLIILIYVCIVLIMYLFKYKLNEVFYLIIR